MNLRIYAAEKLRKLSELNLFEDFFSSFNIKELSRFIFFNLLVKTIDTLNLE